MVKAPGSAAGINHQITMKNEQEKPDADWMRSLVDAHAADLVRYAGSILQDMDAARDVVQDTFLKLWQRPLEDESGIRPWLFRVCRNGALDARRKGGRMKPVTDTDLADKATEVAGPQEAAEKNEQHSQVLRLMKDLPENQQEVVRLKFQNGMSYKEIASVTELSVSNVGFLLHTAINTLRTRCNAVGE